jgi:hypothetical protein
MTSTKILRRVGVVVGSLALLFSGAHVTWAQESADKLDTATSIQQTGEYRAGDGFKLTDEIILHPRLELEAGYQPNVFYEDDSETPVDSPLMRVGVGALLSTMDRGVSEEAAAAPKVALNADVMLTWHQYFSDNEAAQEQSDLGINALAGVTVNPKGKVVFDLRDGFTRSVRPPPVETARDLDRDKNELVAQVTVKPGGGALAIYGKASWTLDIFESTALDFANRNSFIGALGAKWQWLPKTQINGEASFGLVTSDSPVKPGGDSTPLRVLLGTSTLITPNFGTVLRAGYGNGFYNGANYNSFLALAELRYAFGPTVRIAGGYSRDFADSLIGNFRVDDSFFLRFSAQLIGRVLVGGRLQAVLRGYDGLPTMGTTVFCDTPNCPAEPSTTRDDVLFLANAHVDYQLNQWLVVGALYQLYSDNTDATTFTMGASRPDSLGYVWQEFMVKLAAEF